MDRWISIILPTSPGNDATTPSSGQPLPTALAVQASRGRRHGQPKTANYPAIKGLVWPPRRLIPLKFLWQIYGFPLPSQPRLPQSCCQAVTRNNGPSLGRPQCPSDSGKQTAIVALGQTPIKGNASFFSSVWSSFGWKQLSPKQLTFHSKWSKPISPPIFSLKILHGWYTQWFQELMLYERISF